MTDPIRIPDHIEIPHRGDCTPISAADAAWIFTQGGGAKVLERIAALESVRPAQIQANPHYDHQMQIDALGRRIVALEGRCQGMRRDIDQHAHNVDGNSTDGIYNLSRPGIDYPAPVAADKPDPLDLSTEQIAAIIAFELRHAGNEWACAAAIKGRHTRPSPAEWSQYVPATGIGAHPKNEADQPAGDDAAVSFWKQFADRSAETFSGQNEAEETALRLLGEADMVVADLRAKLKAISEIAGK